MRVFILLLLTVGLILLVTQNGSPQVLVVLGYPTLALPIAVWMAAAIAAGILTSVVLQLLSFRPVPSPLLEPQEPLRRDRITDRPRSPEPSPRKRDSSDWETDPSQNSDWNTETPPPQPNRQPSPRTETFEKPNPPPQSDSTPRPGNRVYDAPYRVINPPVSEPPDSAEPTWVDEADYESDLRREYRDRQE